jgi:hypothetical protein
VTRLLRTKMAVAGILGQRCVICNEFGRWGWEAQRVAPEYRLKTVLQVDHPGGRSYSIRTLNTLQRWTRYLKEALAGKVRAACADCNRKNGGARRYGRRRHAPKGGR